MNLKNTEFVQHSLCQGCHSYHQNLNEISLWISTQWLVRFSWTWNYTTWNFVVSRPIPESQYWFTSHFQQRRIRWLPNLEDNVNFFLQCQMVSSLFGSVLIEWSFKTLHSQLTIVLKMLRFWFKTLKSELPQKRNHTCSR